MKKVSIFLCMVLCSIALHANVVTGTCGDNLTWSYDTDTKALTIEGSGAMYDYSWDQPWAQVSSDILSVSLSEGLTSIGGSAFGNCSSLTSIILPNSVTSIGGSAFSGCSALTSITLPNSVTSIVGSAFEGCSSLTSITIPNSVTSIGGWAFASCFSLTSVSLGNSVTSIGYCAFESCPSLTSITIPNSVTSIGSSAFSSCAQVTVECTTPPTIESGTFRSDANIFVPCSAFNTYLQTTIWQFLDLKGLSHTINLSATEGGKATITATDCDANTATIEALGDACAHFVQWSDGNTDNPRTLNLTQDTTLVAQFESTTTYQVNISAAANGSLTYYGDPIDNIETTMTDCDGYGEWIHNICAVPDDGYYFAGWSDGYADACRSIKVVSDTTLVAHFAEKQQVQVLVGVEPACKNMGTVSGSGSFYQGDVVTITATPNSGYHFVEWSDNGDSHATRDILLTSDTTLFATFAAGDFGGKCGDNLYWTWNNGALTITGTGDMDLFTHPAWWQYEEIQITSVSMPEGMTSISSNAFEGYSIATIIVPASVEEVGDRAFADNDQLTHFEYLGNNIHWGTEDWYWDNRPLYGCRNLQYFRGNKDLLTWNDDYAQLDTVIISNGKAWDYWYDAVYVDNTNASDVIIRGEYDYVNAVRTLYLPAGLVEIGDYALQNARFLGGITIPAGVTRIGISAFEDCRSMDSVIFAGNKVETIGDWAFYNCHSLRSLTLPEGVEEIGRAAFFDCTYLNELTLPSTMKKIADNGFAGCEKLGAMYVNALVPPTIEAKTFEDVDRATPVFVPKGTLERYQADEYWSEFFNMAEYEAPTGNLSTAADNDANALRKVLRNGQVLILRGDKTYTILGEAL